MSSTDKVLSSNEHKVRTTLSSYKDPETGLIQQFVLVEGDSDTFQFLSQLFSAMAAPDEECGRTIHPTGAGSAHFAEGSNLGLMLHRSDCPVGPKH
jgi:hypothetical protein